MEAPSTKTPSSTTNAHDSDGSSDSTSTATTAPEHLSAKDAVNGMKASLGIFDVCFAFELAKLALIHDAAGNVEHIACSDPPGCGIWRVRGCTRDEQVRSFTSALVESSL